MLNKLRGCTYGRRGLIIVIRFLSYLNYVLPKNKRQILFLDTGSNHLNDNTEALYTWLKDNGYDQKYKLVCCVPLESNSLPFANYKPIGVLKGVWCYLTSKYVFFSFGDFRIKPAKNQVVINQWHGTPLKAIGKLTNDVAYMNEKLDNFSYLLSASDFFVRIMSKAFGCDENKVKVLGNTRNDYLFSGKEAFHLIDINKQKYNKVVLWMPTFRKSKDGRFNDGESNSTGLPLFDDVGSLLEFDAFLKNKNVLLILKVHPYAEIKRSGVFTNIKIFTNDDLFERGIKLYEFVKESDVLLTDYSSIYCDYLLLDRPIGFTLDDYESYGDKRGFVFDNPLAYMPGHHIFNIEDLYKFIDDVVNENDKYKERRRELLPFFNKFTDGSNCKRLVDELGITLIEK